MRKTTAIESMPHLLLLSLGVVIICWPGNGVATGAGRSGSPAVAKRIPHNVKLSHPGIHANAPREYTLYELVSPEGVVTGYTLTVDSVVCESGDCQVTKVHMIWDATGGFVDYLLDEGVFLEKAWPPGKDGSQQEDPGRLKGVPFAGSDYQKLDEILLDRKSILRTQKWSGLPVMRGNADVDAVTTATPATLSRSVVKGAALTCFHLWHWAQGDVVEAARELTHERCEKKLLQGLLSSEKTHHIVFALDHLVLHEIHDSALAKRAMLILRDGDSEALGPALLYLADCAEDEDKFAEALTALYAESTASRRIQLIGALGSMKKLPDSLLEGVGKMLKEADRYYEVHLFLRLLEQDDQISEGLLHEIASLLTHDNFFIARRAYWFLREQKLGEEIARRINDFRAKSEANGRILD